jgi:alpha/beta superfamily hydrolase
MIITGADHFFTRQLDSVEETLRIWATGIIEG